jgi:TonB family protein
LILLALLLPLQSAAQDDATTPALVSKPELKRPGGNIRRGQEAWVRMSYVITADGGVIDPIVTDSAGGAPFERAAREHIREWRFESPESGSELPLNHAQLFYDVDRGRGKATRNFMRRYGRIMNDVLAGEIEKAQEMIADTRRIGGWNRYETSMLLLMAGRVAGDTADPVSQLEYFRRAIGVSDRGALIGPTRASVLETVFTIQLSRGQLGNAARTLADLRRLQPDSEAASELDARLDVAMREGPPLEVDGRIYNPCDCDEGVPTWVYQPVYRRFSFEPAGGNVDSFEARCEQGRLQDDVAAGKTWLLPQEWGRCELYVFGDDGADFRLVDGADIEPEPQELLTR